MQKNRLQEGKAGARDISDQVWKQNSDSRNGAKEREVRSKKKVKFVAIGDYFVIGSCIHTRRNNCFLLHDQEA